MGPLRIGCNDSMDFVLALHEPVPRPKAMRGYSRDKRPDCKQVVVGLVLDSEGFPISLITVVASAVAVVRVSIVTRVIRVGVGLNGNPNPSAPVAAPVPSAVPSPVPVPEVTMPPAPVREHGQSRVRQKIHLHRDHQAMQKRCLSEQSKSGKLKESRVDRKMEPQGRNAVVQCWPKKDAVSPELNRCLLNFCSEECSNRKPAIKGKSPLRGLADRFLGFVKSYAEHFKSYRRDVSLES